MNDNEMLKYWSKLAPIDQEFVTAINTLIGRVPEYRQREAMNAVTEEILAWRKRRNEVIRKFRSA